MKKPKRISPLWTIVAAIIILFLIIQNSYVDHDYPKDQNQKDFPENRTIFLTVKEHQFTIRKRGFDSLNDSLKLWEFNKDDNNVYLREESLMPTQYTPLMVIYDKGQDTFEKQENMVPISSFPFSFKNAGTSFQVNQVTKNGKVYFKYLDKELSLKSGQSYTLPYLDGITLKLVTIKNHGMFASKQFRVQKQGEFKKKIDKNHIEIKADRMSEGTDVIYTKDFKLPKLKKGDQVTYSFYKNHLDDGITQLVLTDLSVRK